MVREKEKKMEGGLWGFVKRIAMGNVKSFEYFNYVYIAEREGESEKDGGVRERERKKKMIGFFLPIFEFFIKFYF